MRSLGSESFSDDKANPAERVRSEICRITGSTEAQKKEDYCFNGGVVKEAGASYVPAQRVREVFPVCLEARDEQLPHVVHWALRVLLTSIDNT